jgi:putative ABC transport system substrate-binding protein
VKRRDALSGLLIACAAPSLLAQAGRTATVGVLIPTGETDAENAPRLAAFAAVLEKAGWRRGENLRIEVRHAVGDEQLRARLREFVALDPAVMLVQSNQALAIARAEKIATPIVFVAVADPVGSGFVANLARPGGNVTGFANFGTEAGGKWLQVLRQIAPRTRAIALLFNPTIAANRQLASSVETAATPLGIAVTNAPVTDSASLELASAALAGKRDWGLVVLPNPTNSQHRKQIIEAAARHRVPAVYPFSFFARDGGLVAYGVDIKALFESSAGYVDRILRGARAGDLPVQQPTKYELAINMATARALGLDVPVAQRSLADEVIE